MYRKERCSGTQVQGFKIRRGRHMLTELVGSQERRYVDKVMDLKIGVDQVLVFRKLRWMVT